MEVTVKTFLGNGLLVLLITGQLGCAVGVARSKQDCVISPGGSVLRIAAQQEFPYETLVRSACEGERQALGELLLFTKRTDGEAMLDHGYVLLQLKNRLGPGIVEEAMRSFPSAERQVVEAIIETAARMRRTEH